MRATPLTSTVWIPLPPIPPVGNGPPTGWNAAPSMLNESAMPSGPVALSVIGDAGSTYQPLAFGCALGVIVIAPFECGSVTELANAFPLETPTLPAPSAACRK